MKVDDLVAFYMTSVRISRPYNIPQALQEARSSFVAGKKSSALAHPKHPEN